MKLRFCTADERGEYYTLKKQIKRKRVKAINMHHILMNLLKHRTYYNSIMSTFEVFFGYITSYRVLPGQFIWDRVRKACCKNKKSARYRNQKLFNNGMSRFYNEIDIVNLLKAVRMVKLFVYTSTSQK